MASFFLPSRFFKNSRSEPYLSAVSSTPGHLYKGCERKLFVNSTLRGDAVGSGQQLSFFAEIPVFFKLVFCLFFIDLDLFVEIKNL